MSNRTLKITGWPARVIGFFVVTMVMLIIIPMLIVMVPIAVLGAAIAVATGNYRIERTKPDTKETA